MAWTGRQGLCGRQIQIGAACQFASSLLPVIDATAFSACHDEWLAPAECLKRGRVGRIGGLADMCCTR